MRIIVNGKEKTVNQDSLFLSELIEILQLSHQQIALELNGKVITRSLYPTQKIYEGDTIEIIKAVGGG